MGYIITGNTILDVTPYTDWHKVNVADRSTN